MDKSRAGAKLLENKTQTAPKMTERDETLDCAGRQPVPGNSSFRGNLLKRNFLTRWSWKTVF